MKNNISKQVVKIEELSQMAKHKVSNEIREQIEVAAEVRAYWQVASKRFADSVRATLQVHLIEPIKEECFERLCNETGIYNSITPAKAYNLLRESDETRSEREELNTKRRRLDSALEQIEKFQNGDFNEEDDVATETSI